MRASDLLVTKAGPGAIAEASVSEVPVVIYDYIPGQERGNLQYVRSNGIGLVALTTPGVVKAVRRIVEIRAPARTDAPPSSRARTARCIAPHRRADRSHGVRRSADDRAVRRRLLSRMSVIDLPSGLLDFVVATRRDLHAASRAWVSRSPHQRNRRRAFARARHRSPRTHRANRRARRHQRRTARQDDHAARRHGRAADSRAQRNRVSFAIGRNDARVRTRRTRRNAARRRANSRAEARGDSRDRRAVLSAGRRRPRRCEGDGRSRNSRGIRHRARLRFTSRLEASGRHGRLHARAVLRFERFDRDRDSRQGRPRRLATSLDRSDLRRLELSSSACSKSSAASSIRSSPQSSRSARFTPGTTYNVIPTSAKLKGTVRAFDADVRKAMKERIERVLARRLRGIGRDVRFRLSVALSGHGERSRPNRICARACGEGARRRARDVVPEADGRGRLLIFRAARPGVFLPGRLPRKRAIVVPAPSRTFRHRRRRAAIRRAHDGRARHSTPGNHAP